MKRTLLLALFVFAVLASFSQNYLLQYASGSTGVSGATGSNVYEDENGRIGISNMTPQANLHVMGAIGASGPPFIIQSEYFPGSGTAPGYFAGVRGPSGDGSSAIIDFSINGIGQVGIGGASNSPFDLLIHNHGFIDNEGNLSLVVMDDNNNGLMAVINSGSSSTPSALLYVATNSTYSWPGYGHNPAFIIQDLSKSFSAPDVFEVIGDGIVNIGATEWTAQLNVMQNNTVTDYLFHVGNYVNGNEDLFSVSNSGYVGIGTLNSSTNLLQVSDVNGIGVTTVIEADYSYASPIPPTTPNYFEANRTSTGGLSGPTTTTDFSINNVGQMGVGTIANSNSEVLIREHPHGLSGTHYGIQFQDVAANTIYGVYDQGTAAEPSAGEVIGTNSSSGTYALFISDISAVSPLPEPILEVSSIGTVCIGQALPAAELDVMKNNNYFNYLFHVGSYATTTSDFLTVHNDGYIGIGKFNPGHSLVEESDVAGLGSTMPLFLIDNGTPTMPNPYFVVEGSSSGVNVGIGITPNTLGSTLALQGVHGTALDMYAGPEDGGGWDPQIRFINSGSTALRNVITDNHTSNMLTIQPGYDGSDGALNVLNVQGSVLIGYPGQLYPPGATPGPTTQLSNTYALIVQRGILTEMMKVAVATTADWSDFVFDNNYQLPTFNALETYIKTNKHLPDVPSAEDVVCDGGVDVAKMDAKLLQKIEELNLYVIQLEKENKKQDAQIEELLKRSKN